MRKLIVVDLDGYIYDNLERATAANILPGVPKKLGNWGLFYSAFWLRKDKPIAKALEVLQTLAQRDYEIVYLTGRQENTLEVTKECLERDGFPTGKVICRPATERRKTFEWKAAVVAELSPVFFGDDSEENITAVQALSLPGLEATTELPSLEKYL